MCVILCITTLKSDRRHHVHNTRYIILQCCIFAACSSYTTASSTSTAAACSKPYDVSGPFGAEEALDEPNSRILAWEHGWGKGVHNNNRAFKYEAHRTPKTSVNPAATGGLSYRWSRGQGSIFSYTGVTTALQPPCYGELWGGDRQNPPTEITLVYCTGV